MNKLTQIGLSIVLVGAAAWGFADNAAPESSTQSADAGNKVLCDSGLTIVMVQLSDGAARPGDVVRVHYAGRLESNGEEFDNSYKRGEPIEFPLGKGRVIRGWDEGVAGMKVGEKRQLLIPSKLGYGEKGTPGGPIPPNANLVFDVELVGIKRQ
jgi:FKBP-type peptidyl-prolyl cis-trans isomerase